MVDEDEEDEEVRLVDVSDTALKIKSGAIAITERRNVKNGRKPKALK